MAIGSWLRWNIWGNNDTHHQNKNKRSNENAVKVIRYKRQASIGEKVLGTSGKMVKRGVARAAYGGNHSGKENSHSGVMRKKRVIEVENALRAIAEALGKKEQLARSLMLEKKNGGLGRVLKEGLGLGGAKLVKLVGVVLYRLVGNEDVENHEIMCGRGFLRFVEGVLSGVECCEAGGKGYVEGRRLAAKTVRKLARYSEKCALVIGRDTGIVRLLVVVLKREGKGCQAEAAAAVANLARHGLKFQAYIRKHKGIPALVRVIKKKDYDPTAVFHAMRALTEFSLHPRWQVLMITEGAVPAAVDLVEVCPDIEIVSEATRFIGNISAEKTGREAATAVGGVEVLSYRAAGMVNEVNGVYEYSLKEKEMELAADVFRAMANVCVGYKEATRKAIAAGGVTALVAACDTEKTDDLLKVEAFRGLLIIAQAGSSYRAAVLREISFRVKVKVAAGKLYDHLYDLSRRIKVEACADRKDEAPETIAGLSELANRFVFGSAAENAKTMPGAKSEAARAFRPSGRVLSVAKPAPRQKRKCTKDNRSGAVSPSRSPCRSSGKGSGNNSSNKALVKSGSSKRRCTGWTTSSSTCSVAGTGVEPLQDMDRNLFDIGKPLGRGGYATVFLAKNRRTKELVAIKRFHPPCSSLPNAKEIAQMHARRALKERHIWEGLFHKNVVSYLGCFFNEDGALNLVAEYVPGWSLADHLAHITKFPEHLVAKITCQIVDGLDYLHRAGVTHRDLKPANIMIDPEGTVKITDFGVSSALDVPTMTGNTLVGTPWYIAPEMIEGRPYGKSVDVWSLGCTVLELATGRRPYHDLKAHQALFKMVSDRMPPIADTLSPVCRDFLKTCWVWKPEQRPYPTHLRRHPFLANAR